jgi:hypothetical protein
MRAGAWAIGVAIFFAVGQHSNAQGGNTINAGSGAVIIFGNENAISDNLKNRQGADSAVISRSFDSEKTAELIGDLDQQGFQVINKITSGDSYQYFRVRVTSPGNISARRERNVNMMYIGLKELTGKDIFETSNEKFSVFVASGEYLIFVRRYDKPTSYILTVKHEKL